MRLTRFLLVLAALAAAPIQAQQIAGSIVGTVTDASGSVVPDAAITITSVRTNAARETRTDTSGNYTLPFLSPASTGSLRGKRIPAEDC